MQEAGPAELSAPESELRVEPSDPADGALSASKSGPGGVAPPENPADDGCEQAASVLPAPRPEPTCAPTQAEPAVEAAELLLSTDVEPKPAEAHAELALHGIEKVEPSRASEKDQKEKAEDDDESDEYDAFADECDPTKAEEPTTLEAAKCSSEATCAALGAVPHAAVNIPTAEISSTAEVSPFPVAKNAPLEKPSAPDTEGKSTNSETSQKEPALSPEPSVPPVPKRALVKPARKLDPIEAAQAAIAGVLVGRMEKEEVQAAFAGHGVEGINVSASALQSAALAREISEISATLHNLPEREVAPVVFAKSGFPSGPPSEFPPPPLFSPQISFTNAKSLAGLPQDSPTEAPLERPPGLPSLGPRPGMLFGPPLGQPPPENAEVVQAKRIAGYALGSFAKPSGVDVDVRVKGPPAKFESPPSKSEAMSFSKPGPAFPPKAMLPTPLACPQKVFDDPPGPPDDVFADQMFTAPPGPPPPASLPKGIGVDMPPVVSNDQPATSNMLAAVPKSARAKGVGVDAPSAPPLHSAMCKSANAKGVGIDAQPPPKLPPTLLPKMPPAMPLIFMTEEVDTIPPIESQVTNTMAQTHDFLAQFESQQFGMAWASGLTMPSHPDSMADVAPMAHLFSPPDGIAGGAFPVAMLPGAALSMSQPPPFMAPLGPPQMAPMHTGLPPFMAPPHMAPPGPPPGAPPVFWEENMSPHGVPYFHCKTNGESRWVRPNGPQDVVGAPTQGTAPPQPAGGQPAPTAKQQLGEPESWESIGKTGWKRVETDKGFTYFFHKKRKITSWTCPKEIEREVAELDGALAPPEETGEDPKECRGEEAPKVPTRPKKAERAGIREQQQEEEQKLAKGKEALRNFKQMLMEKGVQAFDKYEKWMPKLIHDSRFLAIPGKAERKALFEALAKKIDADKRKQAAAAKKGGREVFREILVQAQHQGFLKDRTPIAAIKAIGDKFGDDDRWDAVPELQRERLITEAVEEAARADKQTHEKAQHDFRELVLSMLPGQDRRPPTWAEARRKMEKDERWEPVGSSATRERIYHQVMHELEEQRRKKLRRQRMDEEEAEVARKKRRRGEAEEMLIQLLTEKVKAPYLTTWTAAKKALIEQAKVRGISLDREGTESIWEDYLQSVTVARGRAFLQHLGNTSVDVVGPEMEFATALERIFADDSCAVKSFAGVPEETLRAAWADWRELACDRATSVCRDWLRSCEHFRGMEDTTVESSAFEVLLNRLSQDVRFLRLGARPDEQRRLVAERLEELRDQRARARSAIEQEDAT